MTSLERAERGWWHGTVDMAADGARYRLRLDGGDELPDPRSRRQPDGVHGDSMTVDPTLFEPVPAGWQPPALAGAVIYELHIGTFTEAGTFDAAADRLDHLVALGVTHVEVMPVAAFPGRYGWGYDGVHLFAAHEPYGGPTRHGAVRAQPATMPAWPCSSTSSTTTSAPTATTSAGSGRTSPTGTARRGGTRSTSTAPAPTAFAGT